MSININAAKTTSGLYILKNQFLKFCHSRKISKQFAHWSNKTCVYIFNLLQFGLSKNS